ACDYGVSHMARRDEEKKRRRMKRLQQRAQRQSKGAGLTPDLRQIQDLEQVLQSAPAAVFPGAQDASLDRPDMVKFEYAMFATEREPGRGKSRNMEHASGRGMLGQLADFADHWVAEEFLWHGVPGDSWHPLDAFLSKAGDRFSPD